MDIPVDAQPETYDAARGCKPYPAKGDCVVTALTREIPILTDPNASPTTRAQALKFVTHFVGDLHQPLHCAERNGDAGGNGVKVTFFGATHEAPPFQHSPWNLHAVWDGGGVRPSRSSRRGGSCREAVRPGAASRAPGCASCHARPSTRSESGKTGENLLQFQRGRVN